MNDPGLDDAVADEAGALDQPPGRQETQNDENQAPVDHRHPEAARWWLASTAYPLAAVRNPSTSLKKFLTDSSTITGYFWAAGQRIQHLLPSTALENANTK